MRREILEVKDAASLSAERQGTVDRDPVMAVQVIKKSGLIDKLNSVRKAEKRRPDNHGSNAAMKAEVMMRGNE